MGSQTSSAAPTIKYRQIHPNRSYHFFFSHQYYGPLKSSYPRHSHDFFEFFLVESGKVIHQINDYQEILCPGDLRFILPDDTHQLLPEKGKQFTIYNCNIEKELFQNCFRLLTAGELSPDDLLHTVHLNEQSFHELVSQWKEPGLHADPVNSFQSRLSGRILVIRILGYYLKQQDGVNSRPQWLEQLCSQMQNPENFRRGVHRIFELTRYSPEHVSRSIKKYLGMTPQQLVMEYKMQNVIRDLIYSNLSVSRVALQNGFRNYAYFHRVFVKRYECTPLHFRKIHVSDN